MSTRASTTRRSGAASAISGQAVVINTSAGAPAIAGASVTANTIVSLGIVTPGQTSSQSTVQTTSPAIANIQYLYANYVVSPATAVSTAGGNILINGTGFVTGSNVYVNGALATATFINSTSIRALVPAASPGTATLTLFSPTNSGTFSTVSYSGAPVWTTSSITLQNNATANVALVAASDSTLTYTLQAGSTLPTGMSLVSTGYISGTPTGYGSETASTAVIVATDLENQATQQTISFTVTVGDPQFNYVTALINGETSVTPFIDDQSTNNYPIGIAGDTRSDRFSPYYGGYYSNYFDGTGDYLAITGSQTPLNIGTNSFTVETWINTSSATQQTIFNICDTNSLGYGAVRVQVLADKTVQWLMGPGGSWGVAVTAGSITYGTWNHIAITRNGSSVYFFVNGTQVGTTQTYATSLSSGGTTYVGYNSGTSFGFNGYISNLRFVNGTALYTSNFTPSTTPLTAVTNTALLTCQSNRLIDNSTNNFTIVKGGDTTVSAGIPFTASATYATYGSAYFDGTGDWLTFLSSYLPTSAGVAFTLEFWIYPTRTFASAAMGIISSGNIELNIDNTTAGQVRFDLPAGVTNVANTGSNLVTAFAWNHIALTRTSGNVYTLYLNGVTTGAGLTAATGITALSTFGYKATNPLQGYVTDLRSVSSLVYTSAFTPPTQPLTAIANTNLLSLQYNGGATNSGIVDNGPFDFPLIRNGNATQGTFSPFSQTGWSNYFDGAGDYLGADSSNGTLPGDFTVEMWVYLTSSIANQPLAAFGTEASGRFALLTNASGQLQYGIYGDGTVYAYTTLAVTLNTWTYIAFSRTGTNMYAFINGVSAGAVKTLSGSRGNGTRITIGSSAARDAFLTGYMSNVRIINGTGLYTTDFTPSTTPLTAVANTELLTCQSNRFVDNSVNNFTITRAGEINVQAYSPFPPTIPYSVSTIGGSGYFDGTGDYLTNTSSPNVANFGTGDFTWESWIYFTSTNTTSEWDIFEAQPTAGGFQVYRSTANTLLYGAFGSAGNNITPVNAIPVNQWFYLALSRTSGSVSCYINGVRQTTVADTTNYNQTGISVGARNIFLACVLRKVLEFTLVQLW
jgi:Concanavalin A-like lectin/glucanases superfamily/IPT/TIG domain